MSATRSEVHDGMQIDWDVPITMDDGLGLKADSSVRQRPGNTRSFLTYGPYAKGLSFQQGYPGAWDIMAFKRPDVPYGSTNKYQNWEVLDPKNTAASRSQLRRRLQVEEYERETPYMEVDCRPVLRAHQVEAARWPACRRRCEVRRQGEARPGRRPRGGRQARRARAFQHCGQGPRRYRRLR